MSAFIDALRRELPDAVRGTETEARLVPTGTADLSTAFELARTHGGRLRPPGGTARDGDVPIILSSMAAVESIDETSRIAHVQAGATVSTLEARLRPEGLTLGCRECVTNRAAATDADANVTRFDLGTWIARGAPGRRPAEDDPVDQVLCGAELVLADGRVLELRPAPRRAVGPDLLGVLLGGRGRLGVLTALHLVVRPRLERERVVHLFPDLDAAEKAGAWARGRGLRANRLLSGTCAEGAALWAELNLDALARTRRELLQEVCAEYGGRALSDDDAPPWPAAREAESESPVLEALAARLDPRHVLSGP